MVGLAASGRHGLRTRAHGHDPGGVGRGTVDAVGIGHDEARLVGGTRLQIQDAAGKHVRRDEIEHVALEHLFAMESRQRHAFVPRSLALLPERHVHAGVSVRVAIDVPLEAEVDERRMLDHQLAGSHRGVAGRRDQGDSHE
jgi:hypothetical protein